MKRGTARELHQFGVWASRLRKKIRDTQERPKAGKPLRPKDAAEGLTRRIVYRYYRRLKKERLLADLEQYVRERGARTWNHPGKGVAWVFRLIETKPDDLINVTTRSNMIAELNFADKCDVPSGRLLGFLHEAGNISLIKKAAAQAAVPSWARYYSKERPAGDKGVGRTELDRPDQSMTVGLETGCASTP